jgi:deoxyxylulose-5-phosphate synthase
MCDYQFAFCKTFAGRKIAGRNKKIQTCCCCRGKCKQRQRGTRTFIEYVKNEIFVPLENICIPDKFISHGSRTAILEELGFSKEAFLKLMIDK